MTKTLRFITIFCLIAVAMSSFTSAGTFSLSIDNNILKTRLIFTLVNQANQQDKLLVTYNVQTTYVAEMHESVPFEEISGVWAADRFLVNSSGQLRNINTYWIQGRAHDGHAIMELYGKIGTKWQLLASLNPEVNVGGGEWFFTALFGDKDRTIVNLP